MMNDRIYYSREAEMRALRNRTLLVVFIAAFGAGLGALAALLMAPRSGDKTRQQVAETLSQATEQGREVAGQVLKTVREGAGRLQEEVAERLQKSG
jgi:gas vesicle protein